MKKGLAGLFLLGVLTIISIYIFIPARINITTFWGMKANRSALYRYLSDQNKWVKWWPFQQQKAFTESKTSYTLNSFSYRLTEKLYNAVELEAIQKNQIVPGKIVIFPVTEDSLIIQWQSSLSTSLNPFTRVRQYFEAVNIKKDISVILESLRSFVEDKERVYRFNIRRTTLKDTALITTEAVTTTYPSTTFIYHHIERLQNYIHSQNALQVNYPRLNITKKDSNHYEMMLAIPTNYPLPGTGNIVYKRMLIFKDKTLTADVTGGPGTIKEAHNELRTYISDYDLINPVLPWESLITDRSKEADTTKWITEICIPVAN